MKTTNSTIAITGGTGLIGAVLSKKLAQNGYKVVQVRRKDSELQFIKNEASGKSMDETSWLNEAKAIIHLAGANISEKRWTKSRKKELIDSRVKTAEWIYNALKHNPNNVKTLVSASAIGIYGTCTSEKIFEETEPPADDFLGDICQKWEASVDNFEHLGIRTVKIRTGIVLTKKGGALAKMTGPLKLGFGAVLGSGKQYLPWIHIEDLCNMYIKALEDTQMKGAYNAVAPSYVTNNDFTKTLAKVLKKPLWLPHVPAFVLKIFFGKMASLLLEGSRVSAQKILLSGFEFTFFNLNEALGDLLD